MAGPFSNPPVSKGQSLRRITNQEIPLVPSVGRCLWHPACSSVVLPQARQTPDGLCWVQLVVVLRKELVCRSGGRTAMYHNKDDVETSHQQGDETTSQIYTPNPDIEKKSLLPLPPSPVRLYPPQAAPLPSAGRLKKKHEKIKGLVITRRHNPRTTTYQNPVPRPYSVHTYLRTQYTICLFLPLISDLLLTRRQRGCANLAPSLGRLLNGCPRS